jgi:hypothetical protein
MVLVSILGDFHSSILPIFFEFKEKLTHHIILHDDSKYDQNQLNAILKGQSHFITHYEGENGETLVNCKLVPLKVNEDSYQSIIQIFDKIKNSSPNPSDIFLNATDGLSSIGIILSSKLLELGSNVIVYDRFANTYNLHTKDTMQKKQIHHNIDIKNHLILKGYNLLSFTNKFELKNRKEQVLQLSSDLARFKKFSQKYPNVSSEYQDLVNILNTITNIEEHRRGYFLQGVVFEEYIYWLIKDNFEFDDVMTSVSVEFDHMFTNEFDILMIKNNHLHTIECKFTGHVDGEHFVYKIDSTRDYLDDDGKAMILSVGNTELSLNAKQQTKRKGFSEGDLSRAKNNGIKIEQMKIFDKEQFLKDVRDWFCTK